MLDGINVLKDKVSSKTILGWLRRKGLDGFIVSNKV